MGTVPSPLLPALLEWLLGDVCLPPLRFSDDGTAAIEPDAVVSLTGGARLLKFLRPAQFHPAPVELQVSVRYLVAAKNMKATSPNAYMCGLHSSFGCDLNI